MTHVFQRWHCAFGALLALVSILASCGNDDSAPRAEPEPKNGHERMLRDLRRIAESVPDDHPLLGTARARQLREQLESLPAKAPDSRRMPLHFQLGTCEILLNNLEEGIALLEKAHEMLPEDERVLPKRMRRLPNFTRFQLAVAYLRLGETQNCCERNTAESCIVPIRGGGLHTRRRGSEQAIRYLTEVLEHPPSESGGGLGGSSGQISQAAGGIYNQTDDSGWLLHESARWLLNIAYMTLDQYPDGVPERYRLPSEIFTSSIDFPRFENIMPELGIDTFSLSGGVVVDDFDGDGWLDVFTPTWDATDQTRFFRNKGDGTFEDRTEAAGLKGLLGGLNCVQADYDNDGDLDVYIVRGAWLSQAGRHPNSLLQNDGAAHFTDVTYDAGLGEHHYPCKTAAWADYDLDGDLDLYVGNEGDQRLEAPAQLFRNEGDGTFVDVAKAAGLAESFFAMGAVWGDIDGDRYPDLFVSAGGPNKLYRNRGDGTFEDISVQTGIEEPKGSFPAWFWDYDNDGALDLFVSTSSGSVGLLSIYPFGIDARSDDPERRRLQEHFEGEFERMHLYHGDGRGGFEDRSKGSGLDYPAQPMGANFGDLDGDGLLDFYLATGNVQYEEIRPNVMFLGRGGERFVNVTMAGGFGHLQKGHGVAFADIDNDGDLDVYTQTGGAVPGDKYQDALFENPGFGHRWISLTLEGRESNRSAIGTHLHLRLKSSGQERSIHRWVNSGGSFGANPLRQTIGLGDAEEIVSLEVYWPKSDLRQRFEGLAMDQAYRIVEGEESVAEGRTK
ncbi:MAG: CRTAC1 family protein [Planctomycetota bacterium]